MRIKGATIGLRRSRWGLLAVLALVVAGSVALWVWPGPDRGRLWEQAKEEFKAQRWGRAEASLRRLARTGPLTTEQKILWSDVARNQGHPEQALALLADVPDSDPLASRVQLVRGQIELRWKHLPAAERHLRRALELDPKLIPAHRELIFIYGMQLRRAEIDVQFRELAQLVPLKYDEAFLWCLSRTLNWNAREVAEDLAQYIKADPEDKWSRLALADNLRRMTHFEEAEATLAPLPASDPDALALRVQMAIDQGDLAAAQQLLAAGPADHPDLARIRGRLALARRDVPAAIRSYRIALKGDPYNRDAVLGLSQALRLAGKTEEAETYAQLVRELDTLSGLLQRASNPAARRDPKLPIELGATCAAAGLIPQARAWYQVAISLDPLNTEAQQALYHLDKAGRIGE
ncbi:MAG: tetratricopeptide repeat protein [Isosphaeraceae bacterium]|nr:tetratricopeptide repeat protein [Isosphaeraceae bacterium]